MKAATAQNANKGFKTTGLFPTDRCIFDESDFEPASVTEKPFSPENVQIEKSQSGVTDPDRTPSPSIIDQIIQSQYMTLSQPADVPTTDSALSGGPLINIAIANAFTLDELPGSSTTDVVPILDTWIQETPMTPVKCVPSNVVNTSTVTILDLNNRPSTSTEHFTPMVLRPLSKVGPN